MIEIGAGNGRNFPHYPVTVTEVLAVEPDDILRAHAGVIHRGVRPGNSIIGPGGVVKITDFGISDAAGSAPVTATNQIVGTPAYLAPRDGSRP